MRVVIRFQFISYFSSKLQELSQLSKQSIFVLLRALLLLQLFSMPSFCTSDFSKLLQILISFIEISCFGFSGGMTLR